MGKIAGVVNESKHPRQSRTGGRVSSKIVGVSKVRVIGCDEAIEAPVAGEFKVRVLFELGRGWSLVGITGQDGSAGTSEYSGGITNTAKHFSLKSVANSERFMLSSSGGSSPWYNCKVVEPLAAF